MAYTLEGRDLDSHAKEKGNDVETAPCIFCGKPVRHWNDPDGVAWILGSVESGQKRYYLYCDFRFCVKSDKNQSDIWRCGCESDYIENVGETCHGCGVDRAHAVPVEP